MRKMLSKKANKSQFRKGAAYVNGKNIIHGRRLMRGGQRL